MTGLRMCIFGLWALQTNYPNVASKGTHRRLPMPLLHLTNKMTPRTYAPDSVLLLPLILRPVSRKVHIKRKSCIKYQRRMRPEQNSPGPQPKTSLNRPLLDRHKCFSHQLQYLT
ncbi:hypothetical protein H112_05856 [Trichophyton rubrum D6]|uniref:Uncharacterized protein n=3 Tax=Trichophyton TaxID=5550 RepID=F2SKT2_TRIRC|nr:uncharacterized protein TERG_03562 [Trichophyton rubrum CBS 118892]EZF16018.1 hypothetical protein H100_05871 [Trichophyton rubrum MR850]EZF40147.1 hypothetical protein H102_05840 [Trichophyton rubrum CBS 100081]EZF50780.1 hypothetical protein H103_05868 [Trichophyton rubrum CBS 288.86]EZF61376.1 hypothetical protein H104_05853 [Trichophyton rubrum CBS 289.86]EZF72038.1 hypothetical protein H105_05881 [Trichophyton soudanense CBS 452.61]EZF82692.1 hypothetical protein H110_05862 [Trichophy